MKCEWGECQDGCGWGGCQVGFGHSSTCQTESAHLQCSNALQLTMSTAKKYQGTDGSISSLEGHANERGMSATVR